MNRRPVDRRAWIGASAAAAALTLASTCPVAHAQQRRETTARRLLASIEGPSLTYMSGIDEVDGADRTGVAIKERRGARFAFQQELRAESLRHRDSSPWLAVPDHMLEDKYVRSEREHIAEDVLGDALSAAIDAGIRGVARHGREPELTPRSDRGRLRLDSHPSWQLRRVGERGQVRLDVPFTGQAIRLHAWRNIAHDRSDRRVAGTFSVDPFDNSASVAFRYEF